MTNQLASANVNTGYQFSINSNVKNWKERTILLGASHLNTPKTVSYYCKDLVTSW